jgi:hypothetical protein
MVVGFMQSGETTFLAAMYKYWAVGQGGVRVTLGNDADDTTMKTIIDEAIVHRKRPEQNGLPDLRNHTLKFMPNFATFLTSTSCPSNV